VANLKQDLNRGADGRVSAGKEEEGGCHELHKMIAKRRDDVVGGGREVEEAGERVWNGLGFVKIGHACHVAPAVIAANFDESLGEFEKGGGGGGLRPA
jgi:hypothetical protein